MFFYTSDLHLGHANVIRFDKRPFADVEEINQYIINRWNDRVSEDDTVYIVGDICHRKRKSNMIKVLFVCWVARLRWSLFSNDRSGA